MDLDTETQGIDWKESEKKMKEAIAKGCPIYFESKEVEECGFMQKVAEIYLSTLDVLLSAVIYALALGGSYIITFLHDPFLSSAGVITTLVGGYILYYVWRPRYLRCGAFILEIEQKIQSENIKNRKA